MNTRDTALTHHPAPHRDRVMTIESAFGLLAGPAGWFLQLCAGFALASTPCFIAGTRVVASGVPWAWPTMIAASTAGVLLGLEALFVSWRVLQRTKEETTGNHRHLIEVGSGRTRFLALWGVCLGAGFTLVTLLTFVAFTTVPKCVG
jgi:hypothetical protein